MTKFLSSSVLLPLLLDGSGRCVHVTKYVMVAFFSKLVLYWCESFVSKGSQLIAVWVVFETKNLGTVYFCCYFYVMFTKTEESFLVVTSTFRWILVPDKVSRAQEGWNQKSLKRRRLTLTLGFLLPPCLLLSAVSKYTTSQTKEGLLELLLWLPLSCLSLFSSFIICPNNLDISKHGDMSI